MGDAPLTLTGVMCFPNQEAGAQAAASEDSTCSQILKKIKRESFTKYMYQKGPKEI